MSLESFIEKCRAAGLFDSESGFSVDSLAAFRKILASALPETHFYLFQTLQAIVKAECQEIKVSIGRRENRISFLDTQRYFANLNTLAGHFQKGLSVASSHPLDLMMSGLVTSLGAHMDGAEISCGHQKLTVGIQGLKQEKLARPVPTPHIVFRRAQERGMMASWSRIWGARKEEFRVRKGFEYSVTPLVIAGLATCPRANWRRMLGGEEKFALLEVAVLAPQNPNHRGEHQSRPDRVDESPGLYFGHPPQHDPEGQAIAVAPSLMMLALNSAEQPIPEAVPPESWNKRRWTLCFTNCGNSEAEIAFVRNGFTIARESVPLGVDGLKIVAPADHLEVDASGYALVKNDRYAATLDEAAGLIGKTKKFVSSESLESGLKSLHRPADETLRECGWLTV